MYEKPDYDIARERVGMRWSVGGTQGALRKLAGVPILEFNLSPAACVEAYRVGRPLLRETFGDEVVMPGLTTPAVSYGHANGLGCELIFPEGGEVGHTHVYGSLDEGIRALREPVDFALAGMAPLYLDFRGRMRAAFPDEDVGFSYGLEGPLTTAYELRGDGFFTDIFDEPDKTREFMRLMTDSIVSFHRFVCGVLGRGPVDPSGCGLCDDVASAIPPRMWADFVLPYWEQYYAGTTTGLRNAHVEDLRPTQLEHLETIGLDYYDPSVSNRLNPRIIAAECRVPFGWRLLDYQYPLLIREDIRDFVFQAVADGASSVFTFVSEITCDAESVGKVHAFIDAAREVKGLFDSGVGREEIGRAVTPAGRRRFWDAWPTPEQAPIGGASGASRP